MTTPRIDSIDKNFFTNAGFDYWLRGLSKLMTNGLIGYVADRWIMGAGIDGTAGSQTTFSRDTDVPVNVPVKFSAKANGSYATGEEFSFIHRVDSIFSRELTNKVLSTGIYVKSEDAIQVRIKILTPNANNDFSSNTVLYNQLHPIIADSTWQKIKIENQDLGSFDNGCQVVITFIANGNVTASHWIAAPKLSIGTKVQDFSLATSNPVAELELCQKYYRKSYNIDDAPATITGAGAIGRKGDFHPVSLDGGMATIPVVTIYSHLSGNSGVGESGGSDRSATIFNQGEFGFLCVLAGVSDTTVSRLHYTADAEL